MKKTYFNFILLTIFFYSSSYPLESFIPDKQPVQISIPKTGTNLLRIVIHELTHKNLSSSVTQNTYPQGYYYLSSDLSTLLRNLHKKDQFWGTHLMYSEAAAQILSDKKYAVFFMYRDPRDQIISFIFYMKKNEGKWPKIKNMNMQDLILDLIYKNSVANNHPPASGIFDLYNKYLPWITTPEVYSVRFEDLIGSKGGGSDEKQKEIIQQIASHLGISIIEDQIHNIAQNLFGNEKSRTFRSGQIGEWKQYFNQECKDAFKEVAGNLLIELGYEQDLNW